LNLPNASLPKEQTERSAHKKVWKQQREALAQYLFFPD
jgi:hypothetical protein